MAKSFDALARRTMTKSMRARADQRTRELLGEYLLSEIREGRGKSQMEIAAALGIKQPSLSKLEKQTDMQISTLEKIVKVLGGELEIIARFPKRAVRIRPFGSKHRSPRRAHGDMEVPSFT
jgi:transcriptional regulator with XRE-family HTH domain